MVNMLKQEKIYLQSPRHEELYLHLVVTVKPKFMHAPALLNEKHMCAWGCVKT